MNRTEWIRRVAALREDEPASRVHELMAWLQRQGFDAPRRADQLDDEDPADVCDGAEYVLSRPSGSELEEFCIVNLTLTPAQQLASAAMSWIAGKAASAVDLVALSRRAIDEIQSWLGPARVFIWQGDDWLEDDAPTSVALATLTWSDSAAPTVQAGTPEEYMEVIAAEDTTFTVQWLAVKDESLSDDWFLQAILQS